MRALIDAVRLAALVLRFPHWLLRPAHRAMIFRMGKRILPPLLPWALGLLIFVLLLAAGLRVLWGEI